MQFTGDYRWQVIERVRSIMATVGISDDKIWEAFLDCYEKWQMHPGGWRHHKIGEIIKIDDRWFFSRIHDALQPNSKCIGRKTTKEVLMKNWLTCPNRKSRRVAIEVCLKTCETRGDCKELQEISREELHAAMRKLNIPVPVDETVIDTQAAPEETEPVIRIESPEVDAEVVEDLTRKPNGAVARGEITLPVPTKENQQALAAYKRAMSIRTEIEVKFLEYGQVLDEIFSNRYERDIGYTNQKVFCEKALDIKWRTALYLRNIYLWQTRLEIPEREVAEIGWSKAAQILPVAKTKKDAMKWIKKAKEPGMTTQILNAKVRVAQGKITEEEAKILPVKVLLSLSPEQKEIWDRTIEVGKRVTASESIGHIITGAIFPEFLSTYPSGEEFESKAVFVSMALSSFEAAYKVKVLGEIIDESTGEILVKAS